MQNSMENSFEMKGNLNSFESARINLPTVMAYIFFKNKFCKEGCLDTISNTEHIAFCTQK